LFDNDNIYYGAHYDTSNISIFLNTEFVCSVNKYQPPQWRGNGFWAGRGRARKHKI